MKTKIFNIVQRDFLRKLVAFAFAILIYLTIALRIDTDMRINNIPVQIEYPDGFVKSDELHTVSVIVSGNKNILSGLSEHDLRSNITIKAKNFTPGIPHTVRMRASNFKKPFGVNIDKIIPSQFEINLEPIQTKKVPVNAIFNNDNAQSSDYKVAKVNILPKTVTISGALSLIQTINHIDTTPIPLDNSITSDFSYNAKLTTIDGISVLPKNVKCHVDIIRQFIDKEINNVPIGIEVNPTIANSLKFKLDKSICSVELSGISSQINRIQTSNLRVSVNAVFVEKVGEYQLSLKCYIDNFPKVRVKNITPSKIKLKVTK